MKSHHAGRKSRMIPIILSPFFEFQIFHFLKMLITAYQDQVVLKSDCRNPDPLSNNAEFQGLAPDPMLRIYLVTSSDRSSH